MERVMQRQLSPALEKNGKRLDVLNFGVYAYSLAQEYLTLRDHVWKYDPQIVILVLDELVVLKNTLKTKPDDIGGEAPTYSVRDGHLVPDEPTPGLMAIRSSPEPLESRTQQRFTTLKNQVRLLSMASWARSRFKLKWITLKESLHSYFRGGTVSPSTSNLERTTVWPYRADVPEMQEDWDITKAFLREMKAESDRHGAEFLVVVSDLPNQTHPSVTQRMAFQQQNHLRSLYESDQHMEDMCRQLGIEVLTLAHPMGEYASKYGVFLHLHSADNTGHWNIVGNQLAGYFVANELQTRSATFQAWEASGQQTRKVESWSSRRSMVAKPRGANVTSLSNY
jgi:hypothetical protein